MRIEILVFDGVDELDVFGPFEALSGDDVEVVLVALDAPRTVRTCRGVDLRIVERPGEPDGLVVPGGGWLDERPAGARAEVRRGDVPRHVAEHAARGGWTASVCTGAFLLGEAGLLQGRAATTNSHALEQLRPYAGRVLAERVVDAGPVITSGGPSCGLDLGLHLIERFQGAEAAARHADAMDYSGRTRAIVSSAAGTPHD